MKNNIPAFPSHGTMGEVIQQGMTLRDYFAAKVLQGLVANPEVIKVLSKDGEKESLYKGLVENSFGIADTMLIQREKEA